MENKHTTIGYTNRYRSTSEFLLWNRTYRDVRIVFIIIVFLEGKHKFNSFNEIKLNFDVTHCLTRRGSIIVQYNYSLYKERRLFDRSTYYFNLFVRNMHILFFTNSCSVDPYLFENFNTVDGDFLTAKFRAFKFPESTYVQFKGTVNVCLDKCRGVSTTYITLR